MPFQKVDLTGLIAEVTNTTGVEDSATKTINGILDSIAAANAESQAAVTAEIARLRAASDPLAAAVAASPGA